VAKFHGSHTVDVLFHFVEEIIPTTDQATFVLVADHLQLIGLPNLTHLRVKYSLITFDNLFT
jgi:hypothetical protein